jgi:hypothetical protein
LAGASVVLVIALGFGTLNASQRVTLDLGIFTLYRVPVSFVAFAGLFLGMFVMLVAGIYSDLRVRDILRSRLQEEGREERERIDKNQRDLFKEPD